MTHTAEAAVEAPVEITTLSRPERIIRRLAEGTTPIPNLAKEYGVSPQRIHSIAKVAETDGKIERLVGLWPATFRAGPKLLETANMGHDERPSASVRFHALQSKVAVVADSLTGADLSDWETWDTGHGTMAKTEIRTNGRRMGVQLRGRDSPILVVGVPPERTDIAYGERIKMDMGISRAVENVKGHVSEFVFQSRTSQAFPKA